MNGAHHSTDRGTRDLARQTEFGHHNSFQHLAWGHSVTDLLRALPNVYAAESGLLDTARELDEHYIQARYLDSYPAAAPFQHYTRGEAVRAVSNAESIIDFCEGILAEPQGDGPTPDNGDEGAEDAASGD